MTRDVEHVLFLKLLPAFQEICSRENLQFAENFFYVAEKIRLFEFQNIKRLRTLFNLLSSPRIVFASTAVLRKTHYFLHQMTQLF